MYFKNIFWDGSLDSANYHLNCEVCGERLGRHNGKAMCLPLHKYQSTESKPAPSDWTEYPHSTAGQTFMPKDGAGSDFLPALSGSDLNSIQLDGISSPVFAGSSGGINREAGEFKGYDDLPGPRLPQSAPFDSFAWLEFLKLAAPDVAAVEDTSLPPRHRNIVNAKEGAQAAREKAEAEALAKSEQEKSDQLKRDGEALSRDFDNQHGHRMGRA